MIYKNSQVSGVQPNAMSIFIYRSRYGHKMYPKITTAFPQISFERLQFDESKMFL